MRRGKQLTALKRPSVVMQPRLQPMLHPRPALKGREAKDCRVTLARKSQAAKPNSQQVLFQNMHSNANRKTGDDMLQDAHAKTLHRAPLSLQTADEEPPAKLVC